MRDMGRIVGAGVIGAAVALIGVAAMMAQQGETPVYAAGGRAATAAPPRRTAPGAMTSPLAAPDALRFVQWVDPAENAFAVEVPAGWRMQGGTQRVGLAGARAIYRLDSPDGAIQIFGGDPVYAQRFLFPSQVLCSMSPCPGRQANGDIAMPFMPAAQMGQELAQRRFGRIQVTGAQERSDLTAFQRRNEPVLQGAANHVSAGETGFRLADGRTGWVITRTSGQEMPQLGGTWYVNEFYGFVAAPGRERLAARVLAHLIASNRVSPQWFTGEMRGQQQAAAQYLQYMDGSQQLQAEVIAGRWAADDQRAQGQRELLGDKVEVVDPETGQRTTVKSGSTAYWRHDGPTGSTIVGTDTEDNPDPNGLTRQRQVGKDMPYR